VFIDGLHTYQQSLKDVLHSLDHLHDHGVVVMHDCNPIHPATGYPAGSFVNAVAMNLPGWTGAWCGDVWQTICYLRSQRKDLHVFVLDCDYGLGVVTRGIPANQLDLTPDEIDRMSYDDLANNRQQFLNLKDESYLFDFLDSN